VITYQTIYNIIFSSSFTCCVFVIWFSTDVLVDYLKIFQLDKIKIINDFFLLKQYNKSKVENIEIFNYTDFLREFLAEDSASLGKMLSCKYCFGFWLVAFSCSIFGMIIQCGIVGIIMSAPISYLLAILMYDKLFEIK